MSRLVRLFSACGVLLLVSCDHATKHLAKTRLEGRAAVELVPGVLDLRYAENRDTAFSLVGDLLAPGPRFLLLSSLALLATFMVLWLVLRHWQRLDLGARMGAALMLAGALGNTSDRLLRGYVVDFLHLHHWPIFNLADMAICAGTVLLLFSRFGARRPKLEPEREHVRCAVD
jgi:signal peptidase II